MPQFRHRRFAVFVQLDTEHGRGILRGVAQYFRRHPEITVLKFNKSAPLHAAELRRLKLDGVIAKISTPREANAVQRLNLPIVNISGRFEIPLISTVNTDDERVGRLAFRHLHGRGYRHLGYCGSQRHRAARLRWEGFCSEAQRQNIPTVQRLMVPVGEQNTPLAESIRARVESWIQMLPKPVGVFVFTDRLALELDEICHRLALRVPDEVAILGVGNDLTRLGFAHVDISSIQLNTQRIGSLAAETLLHLADGTADSPCHVYIHPLKIVTRLSTDRFAVDDEIVSHALDYIREHAGNVVYVDEIARTTGVSRRQLEMRFRRAIGSSVYAEVQRLHFEHAVELMADPELTLGEIAYAAGFQSAQLFSSAFHRCFHEPPSIYRLRILGHAARNRPVAASSSNVKEGPAVARPV